MKFLTVEYWVSSGAMVPSMAIGLLILFIVMIGASIALSYYVKGSNKELDHFSVALIQKLQDMLATMGGIGVLLAFLMYEGAYIMSTRLWLLIWAIGVIAWLVPIYKYYNSIAEKRAEKQRKREFKKYLPK